MSAGQDLVDDFVHHAHLQERFKTAQGNKAVRYTRKLNKTIADYLLKKRTIETKKDYARTSRWIKEQCVGFSEQMLNIVKKDIHRQFGAEQEWLSSTIESSAVPDEDKTVNNVFFGVFNETDTIEGYITRLADWIYHTWDGQLRIAYATKTDLKLAVSKVLED